MISKSPVLIRGVISPLLLASVGGNEVYWCQLLDVIWCELSVSVVCVSYFLLIRVDVTSEYQFKFWFVVTDVICQCGTFSLLLCLS
jgi:hypothetical protein